MTDFVNEQVSDNRAPKSATAEGAGTDDRFGPPAHLAGNPIVQRIFQLKRELKAVILAHNYTLPEVQDIGDFVADSLELARTAAATDAEVIVFAGVTFMGETAKILSPDKQVLMPTVEARCPMADEVRAPQVAALKKEYPRAAVVAYVNTLAEVKAISDICCTSANAIQVVNSLDSDEVLFVPDRSLGEYVQRFTGKKLHFAAGYCPTHHRVFADDIRKMKRQYPQAAVLVHPECTPDVIDLADRVGSTSGIMRFVREMSGERDAFIIGTEVGLLHRLEREHPGKTFILPGPLVTCPTMKRNTLARVLEVMEKRAPEITLPEDIRKRAFDAVQRMLEVG